LPKIQKVDRLTKRDRGNVAIATRVDAQPKADGPALDCVDIANDVPGVELAIRVAPDRSAEWPAR
jgi:hypothetical protein